MWSYCKLILWGIAWLIIWAVTRPFKGAKEDNCLTWAQRKQDEEGGYLVIRWCRTNRVRWLKWPHFMWMSGKHQHLVQHFIPNENANTEKVFPRPWFEGHIKHGDSETEKDEN